MMIRILRTMLLPAFTGLTLLFGTMLPAAARTVVVTEGTPIPLQLLQELNSKYNRVGDKVNLKVLDDVVVNDRVVIARDTMVHGMVTESRRAGIFGKSGKLAFSIFDVPSVDGQRVSVRATMRKRERGQECRLDRTLPVRQPAGFSH